MRTSFRTENVKLINLNPETDVMDSQLVLPDDWRWKQKGSNFHCAVCVINNGVD